MRSLRYLASAPRFHRPTTAFSASRLCCSAVFSFSATRRLRRIHFRRQSSVPAVFFFVRLYGVRPMPPYTHSHCGQIQTHRRRLLFVLSTYLVGWLYYRPDFFVCQYLFSVFLRFFCTLVNDVRPKKEKERADWNKFFGTFLRRRSLPRA